MGRPELAIAAKGAGRVIRGAGGIGARILGPLSQGLLNAMLTIRLGIVAMEECRPLPFEEKVGDGMLRELFNSVCHAARRAMTRRSSGKHGNASSPANSGDWEHE
jgi:uncharacterized membrane protein YcjF (UPF0283 family)